MKYHHDPDVTVPLPVVGKTVMGALYYTDDSGYTRLVLTFTDGTALTALERGQTGYFEIELAKGAVK